MCNPCSGVSVLRLPFDFAQDRLFSVTVMLSPSGVEEWNQWRGEHLYEEIDLQEADLRWENLSMANLSMAKLIGTRLDGADLSRAAQARMTGIFVFEEKR